MGYNNASIYCDEELEERVREHVEKHTEYSSLSKATVELWKRFLAECEKCMDTDTGGDKDA